MCESSCLGVHTASCACYKGKSRTMHICILCSMAAILWLMASSTASLHSYADSNCDCRLESTLANSDIRTNCSCHGAHTVKHTDSCNLKHMSKHAKAGMGQIEQCTAALFNHTRPCVTYQLKLHQYHGHVANLCLQKHTVAVAHRSNAGPCEGARSRASQLGRCKPSMLKHSCSA